MPKYCSECGESLADSFKYCPNCATPVDQVSRSIEVKVDKDINGVLNVAARDVIQASIGNLVDCKYCNGTGEIIVSQQCMDCSGKGYKSYFLSDSEARKCLTELIISGKEALTSNHDYTESQIASIRRQYRYFKNCSTCGGDSGEFVQIRPIPPALGLPQDVKKRSTKRGTGQVPVKELCSYCNGQGKVRL